MRFDFGTLSSKSSGSLRLPLLCRAPSSVVSPPLSVPTFIGVREGVGGCSCLTFRLLMVSWSMDNSSACEIIERLRARVGGRTADDAALSALVLRDLTPVAFGVRPLRVLRVSSSSVSSSSALPAPSTETSLWRFPLLLVMLEGSDSAGLGNTIGDEGALMGLISSGPGRTGDPGDPDISPRSNGLKERFVRADVSIGGGRGPFLLKIGVVNELCRVLIPKSGV
jgi:hypothetical protein